MTEPELIRRWWPPRRRNSWWMLHVWWPITHFWNDYNPVQLYREVKWFVQRGRRGWSERDLWGLDTYLAGWLPDALHALKTKKCGIPINMFTQEECDLMTKGGHVDDDPAVDRWHATLDHIIEGFEAVTRISDGCYESELGPYPSIKPDNMSTREFGGVVSRRMKDNEALRRRDHLLYEKGMALFVEHFWSLYD